MKKDFIPFLKDVIPSLFQMATLNPEMGIQGSEKVGDIVDVLSEIKPDQASDKKEHFSITTDEIEEKDVAIQMLAVFVDELGSGFAEWVEPTSKILLSMIEYEANDNIRNSVAGALPGLIKCVKEAQQNQQVLVAMGQHFMEKLWTAMKKETETDTLICQVQAMKDIIDEVGTGFFSQQTVDALTVQLIEMYNQSDARIKENNEMVKKEDDEEVDEDEIDEDAELIKEENRNEYDLQLSIAEAMGIIFKTHKEFSANLVAQLFATVLPQAINNTEKQKQKFALFILDDMVEFLGYQYLGDNYAQVAKQIIQFCNSPVPAIRQAASYGIGIMAQNGGDSYRIVANDCLAGLKVAIEFHPPSGDKKSKVKQYNHAKDNAVAALGKIIKYQTATIDPAQFVPHWVSMLPLKYDVEESKVQNEILAQILTEQPQLALGDQFQRFE